MKVILSDSAREEITNRNTGQQMMRVYVAGIG